jgi:SAM-dependent methyltransferase
MTGDDWNGHWEAYAEAARLNPAQAYRRRLVRMLLDLPSAPYSIRVIELGCGQGDFASELAASHPDASYLGLDRSESGIAIARRKRPSASFLVRDIEQPLDLQAEYLGFATHVVCCELLEHVDDPIRVLRNVRPYVAAHGVLVISVPGGPRSAFDHHIGHRRHFTTDSLNAVIREAGFATQAVYGAGFPFFNLFRLAVIASGRQLITRAQDKDFSTRPLSRAVSVLFSTLFRANSSRGKHGWQIIARAVL